MRLNKDTVLCMSLAAKPSNFGTRFHNYLYEALGLNYLYKAFAPTDLTQAIAGVRGLPVRGCAISMPYKEQVIALVDELDASAQAIQSVNTIVNSDGVLKAYNTDYIAIAKLIEKYKISSNTKFILKGSGGMAKAVAFALKNAGFKNGTVWAKNQTAGQALAQSCCFAWTADAPHSDAELLINATPVGMQGTAFSNDLAFSEQMIQSASIIFDVVALPADTPMILKAKSLQKQVIQGSEVFALQALEQFYLYTGVYPSQEVFQAAATFSRAG
ncbi:shikimate 5-dehydrogenase [Acinetobacter sp.]|uniref:shikimate 5-dehydrogenase n=1 Tax=Acinetobacter sp. TaxID=472 RepID=UPI0031DF1249